MKQPTPWWVWLIPLPVVWWAALLVAGVWQPGTDLLQLTAQLGTVLQRPWDIRWTQYSGRCLLLLMDSIIERSIQDGGLGSGPNRE